MSSLDARIGRARTAAVQSTLDRAVPSTPFEGATAVLLQLVAERSYPTTPRVFFAATPITLSGDAVELGAATFTTGPPGSFLYAYNLGSAVPPENSIVVAFEFSGLFVFRYDGPAPK